MSSELAIIQQQPVAPAPVSRAKLAEALAQTNPEFIKQMALALHVSFETLVAFFHVCSLKFPLKKQQGKDKKPAEVKTPCVLLKISGSPGTGKTSLANALANKLVPTSNCVVLDMDVFRLALQGLILGHPPTMEERVSPLVIPDASDVVLLEVLSAMCASLSGDKELIVIFPSSMSLKKVEAAFKPRQTQVVWTVPQKCDYREVANVCYQRITENPERITTLPSMPFEEFYKVFKLHLSGISSESKLAPLELSPFEPIDQKVAKVCKYLVHSGMCPPAILDGLTLDEPAAASVDAAAVAASVDTVAAVDDAAAAAAVDTAASKSSLAVNTAAASEPSLAVVVAAVAASVDTVNAAAVAVDAADSKPSLAVDTPPSAVDAAARSFTKVKSPGKVIFAAVSFELKDNIIGFLEKNYQAIGDRWGSEIIEKNLQIALNKIKLIQSVMQGLEKNAVYSKVQTYLAEMQSALTHPQICQDATLEEILNLYKKIQKLLLTFGVMIQEPDFFWRLDLLPSLQQLLEYILKKEILHATLKFGAAEYTLVLPTGEDIHLSQIRMTQFMLQKGKQMEQHCVIAFAASLKACYIKDCPGDCVKCKDGQAHVTLYTSGCPSVNAAKAFEPDSVGYECDLDVLVAGMFGPTPSVAVPGEKKQWPKKQIPAAAASSTS